MLRPDSGEKLSLINWDCKEKVVHLSIWKSNMYSYIFPPAKKEKESDVTSQRTTILVFDYLLKGNSNPVFRSSPTANCCQEMDGQFLRVIALKRFPKPTQFMTDLQWVISPEQTVPPVCFSILQTQTHPQELGTWPAVIRKVHREMWYLHEKFLLGIWEWGSWLKVSVRDILRDKKGKEAETNFNILTGLQQLPTMLIPSRFSLDLCCYRTGENVVVKLKMILTYRVIILKKQESYSAWLPNLLENTVYFTCLYLIL